jgi:hypothetical protein
VEQPTNNMARLRIRVADFAKRIKVKYFSPKITGNIVK